MISWKTHQGEIPVRCALGLSPPAPEDASVREREKCSVWVRGWLEGRQYFWSCVVHATGEKLSSPSAWSTVDCCPFSRDREASGERVLNTNVSWPVTLGKFPTCPRLCFLISKMGTSIPIMNGERSAWFLAEGLCSMNSHCPSLPATASGGANWPLALFKVPLAISTEASGCPGWNGVGSG